MLVAVELIAGTKLDATTRRSDLGCAQRESGVGDARCGGVQREAQATRGESSAARGTRRGGACEVRGAGVGGSVLSNQPDAR